MDRPEALETPRPRGGWRARMGRDHRPVRAVARAPLRVRTKLLIAFLGIAALLVMVGFLGLRVLGQSNARVERLGTLQLRASAYQTLQAQADGLRALLALRADGPGYETLNGSPTSPVGGRRWRLVDD